MSKAPSHNALRKRLIKQCEAIRDRAEKAGDDAGQLAAINRIAQLMEKTGKDQAPEPSAPTIDFDAMMSMLSAAERNELSICSNRSLHLIDVAKARLERREPPRDVHHTYEALQQSGFTTVVYHDGPYPPKVIEHPAAVAKVAERPDDSIDDGVTVDPETARDIAIIESWLVGGEERR